MIFVSMRYFEGHARLNIQQMKTCKEISFCEIDRIFRYLKKKVKEKLYLRGVICVVMVSISDIHQFQKYFSKSKNYS